MKTKTIDFTLHNERIHVPVGDALFAHFDEQFKRNTENQQRRYTTLMNLLRAVYEAGYERGVAVASGPPA